MHPDLNTQPGMVWHADAAGLLTAMKRHPGLWVRRPSAKYLTLRVDTRDGSFLLWDRAGEPIDPELLHNDIAALDMLRMLGQPPDNIRQHKAWWRRLLQRLGLRT